MPLFKNHHFDQTPVVRRSRSFIAKDTHENATVPSIADEFVLTVDRALEVLLVEHSELLSKRKQP